MVTNQQVSAECMLMISSQAENIIVKNGKRKRKIKEKVFQIENSIDTDRDRDANKIKFSEIRDDDKGFTLWFDPLINYTTYKIYQDFGSQDLTWNLQSKLLEE